MTDEMRGEDAGNHARDRGDVILGWLTRVVVTIALVTSVGFDALSIGLAHVSSSDDANTAAVAASQAWLGSTGTAAGRDAQAMAAADQIIGQHGESLVPGSLVIAVDGSAQLKVRRQATTVLVHRLGPIRSWADIEVAGHGLYRRTP